MGGGDGGQGDVGGDGEQGNVGKNQEAWMEDQEMAESEGW